LSHFGLRAKIISWSFVPTAIILVIVALTTFFAYQQVTETLVIERDQEVVRLSAGELATELSEYSDLLASVARVADISHYDPAVQQAALERASNRLVVFDAGVLILDPFGTVAAAVPARSEIIGQDWSDRPYFGRMVRTPGPIFSDVLPDGPGGAEAIAVAVPIIGSQGELRGIIVGLFRLGNTAVSSFYGDVVRLRLGESGNAYLVDGNGRVIFHSNIAQVGEDFSGYDVVQQVLQGKVNAIRTRDFQGREIVAAFAPVRGTSWGLVSEESWQALVRPSRPPQRFLLLLLALGVVLPAMVVTLGVGRVTRPIRELTHAAQEVAQGNFGRTITARTGDEVEELAQQFNLMSAQLQASYTHLEQKVAARTQELSTLLEVSRNVVSTLELGPLLGLILDQVKSVVNYDGASILGWDGDELRLLAYRGPIPQEEARQIHFRPEQATANRQVVQNRQTVIIPDVCDDSPLARAFQEAAGDELTTTFGYVRSWMGIPLVAKDQVLGMLSLDHQEPNHYTSEQAELALAFAAQAAVAMENARLYEQAQHAATVEERQRLARELHDAVTQTLFSASIIAEVLPRLWERDPDQGRQRLDELRQLTRGALAEMRTLLLELRPGSLIDAELGDLLRQLAESITGRARVPVALEVEGCCALSPEVKVALYRIAQEALNNMVKHARASQAWMSLRCRPEGVTLCVSDDGCGFDPDCTPPNHLGLGIMHERAGAVGARLEIESQAGEGTRVKVVWPSDDGR
jgi:nitrate/nitrite-specific signal transduction histidine kinase